MRGGAGVKVISVFAGGPAAPLSPFATLLHQRWGLPYDAPAVRREEDRAAMAALGCIPVHWELPEAIYRCAAGGEHLYPDGLSIWGEPDPADGPLVGEVSRRIAALPDSVILYVPLGAGGHVDHQLVRRAAEGTGRPLVYYEDYPYAHEPERVEKALGAGEWEPRLVFLDERALAARIAAVACYRSQLSSFWADQAEMEERVRAYARRVGEGRPAERYWRRIR